ncbi:MFS transporter, DHA1 family, inner membrane transport protein [Amycolatopsis pretoriensis]|uniref:MFS transporter, DHA1 family, inner membrane transport protein n=1 Tax=Amycolatopsis pretoriensis TaxID=218821 RepID=A0A1H5R453_9PSEU|nr:MFS transporter [Amycolatopsis pretoriensis]SEF33186.1 MFS transporter, DHA1 family, inner membrane transport protein [Amycolatopsis pretoriensis]
MPAALLALAISAFGIGTTEFVIMGLLPEVAGDFGVSIPSAGLLISGYALGVVVGAPLLTALASRVPRKTVLVALMGLFIVGNVLSALAPSYGLLMTGRVVAALSHGAFFGVGSVVAASLVAPAKQAGAIALMFTGLTVANVLGVPAGTALGQAFGWRSTFWVVSALGVVGAVGILALVPHQPKSGNVGLRGELAVFRRPQVWLALAMTALGFAGVFASFTYIAPMMTEVAGFSSGAVTWLLVLFGAGLFAGNLLGGRAADRKLMPSLYVILAALALVLVAFVFTAHAKVPAAITIALFGAAGFATVPPLQARVLAKAEGAPALASAANIAAFNLGNAGGAWLGGQAIEAGLGYTAPNWIGAVLAAAGLAVALVSGLLDRRASSSFTPGERVLTR